MSKPRTGAPKRVAVGLLAGALAMFGVALAPQAGATTTVTNERLAGATRYGTAAAIAGNAAFATPATAIIATGENFPDALAAASLAGANAAAPIILTEKNAYTAEAKAGLAALKGKGVTAVTIVGGTSAVSDTVETAIKGDGFTVSRIAGDDRYETAAAIASAANTKAAAAPIAGLKAALIATGNNYPDALAGGPAAYANKLPLLLVNDTVPTETANAIATLGIKKVYILGGTAAVSSTVEAQLVQATGNPASRIAGTDRFATATAIADFEQATLAFPVTSAILATGVNFPDALAAGPLGGALKAPVVLTASLPDATKAWLDKNSKTITKLYVAGGTSSVDDATVQGATAAAQTTGNDVAANTTVTSRPEVTAAAVRGTVTTGLLAGTTVRYTFDEAVNPVSAVAGSFHVYSSAGAVTNGTSVAAVTGDANSVDVLFGIVSASTAAGLTVATTSLNAITDLTGEGTPEGDAQLGATGTSSAPLTAGTTIAPDLLTVGNFRAADATHTFVDFTFDQVAVNLASTYALETLAGTIGSEVPCVFDNGGTSTAVITVSCPNGAGVPLSAAAFARGVVAQSTVEGAAAAGSADNPLQAADISNGGNTGTPDLVSATIDFSDSTKDLINLVFDQAVATTGAASTGFQAYSASSLTGAPISPIAGNGGSGVSTSSPNAIQLVFANGALGDAVGVSVNTGAVANVGGSNPGGLNVRDEVGTANAATSSTAAGKTSTPDLIGVKKSAAVDLFNAPTGLTNFTFTFDETVTTATAADFFIYAADGSRGTLSSCTALTASGAPTANVLCAGSSLSASVSAAAVLGTVIPGAVLSATTLGTPANATEGAEVITS